MSARRRRNRQGIAPRSGLSDTHPAEIAAAGLTEVRTDGADRRRRILSLTPGGASRAGRAAGGGRSRRRASDRTARIRMAARDGSAGRHADDRVRRYCADPAGRKDRPVSRAAPPSRRRHRLVIVRQGRLYAGEYRLGRRVSRRWSRRSARLSPPPQPGSEFCWIAELDGLPVGAVMLVHKDRPPPSCACCMSKPSPRAIGIGRLLVRSAASRRGSRRAGYLRLTLWTNDVLVAARRLYERAGFRLTAQATHHSFGQDLVGQTLELGL